MPKAPTPEQMLVVTPEDAETLILQIREGRMDGGDHTTDETVGAFLLLLHSMAYCDPADREDYLRAAERVTLTYTLAFQTASGNLREAAACALKKGGAS